MTPDFFGKCPRWAYVFLGLVLFRMGLLVFRRAPTSFRVTQSFKSLKFVPPLTGGLKCVPPLTGAARPGPVLVILNGQLRGGPVAWSSLQENLLDFYNADLALIGPPFNSSQAGQASESLRRRAKYIWTVPEYSDWGVVLDMIQGNNSNWRALCKYNSTSQVSAYGLQYLGGVSRCHAGSSGILLAYRYLTSLKLIEHSLVDYYEWFIYTRSDYTYLCHPPSIAKFSSAFVYVPYGEGYGGVTDRHTYIPAHRVLQVLNITTDIVVNWKIWYESPASNLEQVIKTYFERAGICYKNFGHTAFTVRRQDDPTRWSHGSPNEVIGKYNLKLKYWGEMAEANESCNVWAKFHESHDMD